MSVCWLRVRGGALIAQVENPTVARRCSWRRGSPGECEVSIPLTDPSIEHLLLDEPVNGRVWRTWYESNIELAWWRTEPDGMAAFATPAEPPTWAGPIVGGRRAPGVRIVKALSQEAYLERSCVGDVLTNYLITNGTGDDYTFADDLTLAEWDVGGSATASATTSGVQYDAGGVALLEDGAMTAYGQLPLSDDGNYCFVGVAVYVPSGVTPLYVKDDGTAVVGAVDLRESETGMGWIDPASDGEELLLPRGWSHDRWYGLALQMRQPAGVYPRYYLSLYGGAGAPIRFARPKIYRPSNVGAAPGSDIGSVAAAIAQDQVDHLIGPWSRTSETVGIDLVEPARYFVTDHSPASSALDDWKSYLDWHVHELDIRTGQRGEEIEVELTNEDLSGWEIEDDATDAWTHLYVQVRPEDGPPDQVALTVEDPATRLTHVVQVPAEMAPSDATEWGQAVLADGEPVRRLRAVPVRFTVVPGEQLEDFMPGNWMTVTLTDQLADDAELIETFQPVVDQVEWDPVADEVFPSWVLGRKAKRDWTEMMAALLMQQERERRMWRPRPAKTILGRLLSVADETAGGSSGANLNSGTLDLPEGLWAVRCTYYQSGGSAPALRASVVDAGAGVLDTRTLAGDSSTSGLTVECTVPVLGPTSVYGAGSMVNRSSNPSTATTTLRAQLIGK